MGIEALAPQPGTSQRAPGNKIYPYLLRKLAIVRSNQVWALDTTYIPMARGFVYLTAVVDVASRRVLAHKRSGAFPTMASSRLVFALREGDSRGRCLPAVGTRRQTSLLPVFEEEHAKGEGYVVLH